MAERDPPLEEVVRQLPGLHWTTDRELTVTGAYGAGAVDADVTALVAATAAAHREALDGGTASSSRIRHGALVLEVQVAPLRDAGGEVVGAIGSAADLTASRPALGLDSYRELFELASEPIVLADAEGRIVDANPALERALGYTRAELVGRVAASLFVPEDELRVAERVARKIQGLETATTYEATLVAKDGRPIPVEASTQVALRDGVPVGVLGIARDTSEQRASRRALEERERLFRSAFEDAAVGMVLTDPYGAILRADAAFAEMLGYAVAELVGREITSLAEVENGKRIVARLTAMREGRDERIIGEGRFLRRDGEVVLVHVADDLDQIVHASERAAALTRQLLAFSRRQITNREVLDVRAVVTEMVTLLRRLLGEDVDLELRSADEPVHVFADATQLEQVVANLAVNARDAMPAGGRLCVTVRRDGDWAVLEVADEGEGMDEDTAAHLFEPFFTTKPTGTGIGLATVHGVVAQSGGTIDVESAPGRGTTFTIRLPVAAEPPAEPAAAPAPARGGHERVLLVEDDPASLAIVTRMLDQLGYRVTACANGEEAAERVASSGEPVDVLVTDLVMRGVDGRATAETVLRHRPETRVLFVSGYTEDREMRPGERAEFLRKPFTRDELASCLRELLDRTP